MIMEKEDELRERMHRARDYVFPTASTSASLSSSTGGGTEQQAKPLFLEDEVFDQFAIGRPDQAASNGTASDAAPSSSSSSSPSSAATAFTPPPNSHLSLLAIVDSWYQLRLQPFQHLTLAATPIFRLWFGVSEYLFRSPERLEAAIRAAVRDKSHRSDDAEFMVAARGWSQCVSFGDFEAYRRRFENTAEWFRPRFEESGKRGALMLKELLKG
jgi:prephenate dehydrogenase (NADP+)